MFQTSAPASIETALLTLRGWRQDDIYDYAALLSDANTARFITRLGRPYGSAEAWAELALRTRHWHLLGFGMFVVEERNGGAFLGRVGALQPPGWPGYEVAWALTAGARGKGFATEAAERAIRWSFDTFPLDRIVSVIHPLNEPSQRVASRLGQRRTSDQFSPFGEACDVWELRRADWRQGDLR